MFRRNNQVTAWEKAPDENTTSRSSRAVPSGADERQKAEVHLAKLFRRKWILPSDDISAVIDTIAVVSALSLASIFALLFVADRDDFQAADQDMLRFSNVTMDTDKITIDDAWELNFPSMTFTIWLHLSLLTGIAAFSGSLFLLFSWRDSGFRPVTTSCVLPQEEQDRLRALHVSSWHSQFRGIINLLIVFMLMSIVGLFASVPALVHIRFPAYAPVSSLWGDYRTTTYRRLSELFMVIGAIPISIIFFAYTVYGHIRVFRKASSNSWFLERSDIKGIHYVQTRQDREDAGQPLEISETETMFDTNVSGNNA